LEIVDGFRALLFLEPTRALLVSHNGNPFGRFAPLADALRRSLGVRSAVIDGEVVRLDRQGRPQFHVLALNGRDLRALPLLERKRRLRRIVPVGSPCVLYAEHIVGAGCQLFDVICARDLGVVAKVATSRYALTGARSPRKPGGRGSHFERYVAVRRLMPTTAPRVRACAAAR
jgi:bifunctional non-homologous end joining protein LigD